MVGNNCVVDGVPCGDPQTGGAGGETGERFDQLDLLFVVDNSSSMAAKQVQLAQRLPDMIETLVSGDVNGDGQMDFSPVTSLHFAVVSTDMGAPGVIGLPDCGDDTGQPLGDDGLFLSLPSDVVVRGQRCDGAPGFVTFDREIATTTGEQELHDIGCAPVLGANGCGYTMPLEAALKSLWNVDSSSLSFLSGIGHGVDTQRDFVRDGALLAVIVVTDDDDCSSPEVAHLMPDDQLADGDPLKGLNRPLRCWGAADRLFKVDRYKNALATLKRGQLTRLFFAVVGGVPIELANTLNEARGQNARQLAYQTTLLDPRMQKAIDRDSPGDERDLVRSCGDTYPAAYPPRRLVELAQLFEPRGTVTSICHDLAVPLAQITTVLARALDANTAL